MSAAALVICLKALFAAAPSEGAPSSQPQQQPPPSRTAPVVLVGSGIGLTDRGPSDLRLRLGAGVRHRLTAGDVPGWAPVATGLFSLVLSPKPSPNEHWGLVHLGWARYAARLPAVPVFESYALAGGAFTTEGRWGWRVGLGLSLNLVQYLMPQPARTSAQRAPQPPRIDALTEPPLVDAEDERPSPAAREPAVDAPVAEARPSSFVRPDAPVLVLVGLLAIAAAVPAGLAVSDQVANAALTIALIPLFVVSVALYGISAYIVASVAVGIATTFPNVELVLERAPTEAAPRPRLMFGLRF